jgi:hypothetical protein
MRVLVVLAGSVEPAIIEQRCGGVVGDGHEVAVCYRFPAEVALPKILDAQREVTAALRRVFGPAAEAIPVFVATNAEGDRVEDCALAWGATDVRA